MQLHGANAEYSLGSTKLLHKMLLLRRVIGSVYSSFFFILFWYLGNYWAMAIVFVLALLAPLLYGYAYLAGKSQKAKTKISNFIALAFSLSIVATIYFAREVDFVYLITYPTTIAVYSASNYRYRLLILILSVAAIGIILSTVLSTYSLVVFLAIYVLVLSFTHLFSMRIKVDNSTLAKLALKDALTGLQNRRSLELDMGETEIIEKIQSVIFLDIDHFKNINDRYGHVFGDEVLKAIASAIKSSINKNDKAYRYGGEEFIIVTQGKESSEATCLKIKSAIEKIHLMTETYGEKNTVTFTASIGLASKEEGKTLHQLVKDADNAMYHAKEIGRNRIVLFGEPMNPVIETKG